MKLLLGLEDLYVGDIGHVCARYSRLVNNRKLGDRCCDNFEECGYALGPVGAEDLFNGREKVGGIRSLRQSARNSLMKPSCGHQPCDRNAR